MKRQIIDCFPFFNELDLLKFRLTELDPYVDKFVLVESTRTFTGNFKPLYYSLNKDLFAQWKDKIIHIVVTDMPLDMEQDMIDKLVENAELRDIHWVREHHQRRAISRAFKKLELSYDDIILVSDLDEIPDLTKLDTIIDYLPMGPVVFRQDWYIWNINFQKNSDWVGGAAFTYSHYIKNKDIFQHIRNIRWEHSHSEFIKIDCGWHFSWFGDINFIKNKMFSFAHTESADEFFDNGKNIERLIREGLPPQVPNENTNKLISTDFSSVILPKNIDLIPHFDVEDKPKVYDCFIFNGELDLLNLRLHELNHVVDTFVIIESTETHSGKSKELHYQKNMDMFEEFNDKIFYAVIDGFPECSEGVDKNWCRENYHRNQIKTALSIIKPKDADMILISDVDEIPNAPTVEVIERMVPPDQWRTLRMRWFNYSTEWELENGWPGTQAIRWGDLKNTEPQRLRDKRYDEQRVLDLFRGWHFSWFGGVDEIQTKLKSFAHQELSGLTDDEIMFKMQRGLTIADNQQLVSYKDWNFYPTHLSLLNQEPIQKDTNEIFLDFI
jgi:beta-1,4-mannosyl-glycoprotein beta-1,4-N-acetylglucosaminyltransferase